MTPDTPFRTRIKAAIADAQLGSALDANADRRQGAFRQAYTSLPEGLQVMRQRAHSVRARTIKDLDHYLEEFIANAQANGMTVHRAASASQAVEIVRQVSQRAGAKVIAKSKSMVSEEIHLTPALEQDGMQVVETDLGEYIVQLRGEPPAHIITPAVHLKRRDVGQTFHEKLDIPFSEDIPTLTKAARRTLRRTFINADIGISGVNFGVAETGGLCLVTNEGNGRLVTTLPEIHIALMGIERLVPTLDDLALMLHLLPRSATGQKLTVYTNLIHGPRRPGEVDGPGERHVVLIDNGRRAMRDSPLGEALYCIRCGACLNVCPVFREIGGHAYVSSDGKNTPYPGPIGSVISPGLFGSPQFGHLARASSLCGACKDACPVDIDLPKLLLRVRAGSGGKTSEKPRTQQPGAPNAPRSLALGLRVYAWIASSPRRFAAAQRLAGALSRLIPSASGWLRLPDFSGWGYQRDFPRPARRPFRDRFTQPPISSDPSRHEPPSAPQPEQGVQSPLQPSLIERFESELIALSGTFTHCREEEIPERLMALLGSRDIQSIQTWDESYLPSSLLEHLRAGGIQTSQRPDPALRVGLTGALAGVADSGTLVLPGGPGRPQTASLLPETHIAILRSDAVLGTLEEALNLPEVRESPSAVLISGPSRTADIEMTLTIGVHGPGEVIVFCYNG